MINSEFLIILTIENKCFVVFFDGKRTKDRCSASAKKLLVLEKEMQLQKNF